ncbi:acyl-CoA dehydrogenase family protein [Amycolatopsis sp. NPDC021455]|uniref:acyl-CoA dehydrogenase family protein n=1 Tax=Amycolatopsis sp. NPDC021455 TaxID=3154901 RepID=UPI0033F950A9
MTNARERALPVALHAAADLERALGDPFDPAAPVSFAELVALDRRGEMPFAVMDRLRELGFPRYIVPAADGGSLGSFEELFALCRVVARRDLRPAVSYGTTMLGSNPVWMWGDAGQRAWLAERILGGGLGSFAMSEADHGSDLGGCEVSVSDGLLTGVKWPIGNAVRGGFLTVYARTSPREFSLLLLDKSRLDPACWRNEPAVGTLGLRGHDLSGIAFDGCPVPPGALLGRAGTGVAKTLKTLQLTRTLIASLSLGSLDTALRLTLAHCLGRRLYGQSVDRLPVVRDLLVKAYLDLLVGECVAVPVTRSITLAPSRLSLWSSVVKYLVPVLAEESIANLATVLSARHYLDHGPLAPVFQKLQRDHAIAGIFEGTTHVNLAAIASQLPLVVAGLADTADETLVARLFTPDTEAPAWRPAQDRLELTTEGRDEITAGWDAAVATARTFGDPDLAVVLSIVDGYRTALHREVAATLPGPAGQQHAPVRAFTLARTHSLLHAAASCLHTYLAGGAEGDWLVPCLWRIVQRFDPSADLPEAHTAAAERLMMAQFEGNLLFSLTPLPLG